MDRQAFVLAAMAAAGIGVRFDPVRLQKYFFLLDQELAGECGCPHFDFRPYHYGPFDHAVYNQIEQLAREGLATIDDERRYRLHGLTEEGFERGMRTLGRLSERARDYMVTASVWVFSLDFRELLASIYEYAPDMAVRSVLPQAVSVRRRRYSMPPFVRGMARSLDWTGALSSGRVPRDTGATALGHQWAAVGGRLQAAMDQAAHGHDDS